MFFKNSLYIFFVAILSPISMNAAMTETEWGVKKPVKAPNQKNAFLRSSLQRKAKNSVTSPQKSSMQAVVTNKSPRKRPSEEPVATAQRPAKKQKLDSDAILARIKWKNDSTPQEQAEKRKKKQFTATGSPRKLPAVTVGEHNSDKKRRLACGHESCPFTTTSCSKLQNHYTAHGAMDSGQKVYPCTKEGCGNLAFTKARDKEHFNKRHAENDVQDEVFVQPLVKETCNYCNMYTMGVALQAHMDRYHNGSTTPHNKRFPDSVSSIALLRDCAKLRALNAAVASKNNMTIEIN